jgi:hypothetical protein
VCARSRGRLGCRSQIGLDGSGRRAWCSSFVCYSFLLAIATADNWVREAPTYLEIEFVSAILAVCGICAGVAVLEML